MQEGHPVHPETTAMQAKQKPPRVLFFDFFPFLGGAEVIMARLAGGLVMAGETPLALCRSGPVLEACREAGAATFKVDFIPIPPLPPINYAAHTINMGRTTRIIRELCHTHQVEVIHANGTISAWYALGAGRAAGVPVVLHLHDILQPRAKERAMVRSLISRGVRVAAVSDAARASLLALGVDETKVIRIHNGLDPGQWRPRPGRDQSIVVKEQGEIRREASTPADAVVFLTLGQQAPWKGIHVFLAAARRVVKRHRNAHFWVVGSPYRGGVAYQARLARLAAEFPADDRVTFLGRRQDINAVLAEADILVQPSIRPDPLPNAVMEAMACGLPVIGSGLGGIPEMVIDGKTGLLVPPDDPGALAEAMEQIIADPKRLESMGRAGRKRVVEEFSFPSFMDSFIKLYREAAADPAGNSGESGP